MPTWMGIDIGSSAVKVAVVRSAYRKTSLEALVAVDVASAGGTEPAVREAVLAAHAGKPPTGDGISVAIEGARAAIRVLSIPANAAKQLTEVLAFELESHVPFDMEGAVFDHRILPAAKGGEKDAPLSVLTGVARIEDVRSRIDLVKSAIHAEPERVGVGPFALANLVAFIPALADDGPIVIVDLGTVSSEILVLHTGEPVFARTLSYGTEGLPGTAPRLAREIRVSIAAFRAAGGDPPVAVFLCGGGAFVSGAESFLAGELELPVQLLPSPALEVSPTFVRGVAREGAVDPILEMPRFAKAIGLAVGLSGRGAGLNLRRGPLSYERGFAWIREKIPVLAGLGAVIAVSFLFSAWTKLYSLSKDEEVAAKALAAVTRDVLGEETSTASRAQELLNQQTTVSDEDPMPHGDAFDVIVRISESIPPSMTHDIEELDVQKGHVVVHGIVGTIPDAQSIAKSLQTEKCFQDVKVVKTNQMVGADRQKYQLELELKCPEDIKGKKKDLGGAGSASAASSAGGK